MRNILVPISVWFALALTGCVVAGPRSQPTVPTPEQNPSESIKYTGPLAGIPAPWAELAGALVASGLNRAQVSAFFQSPDLVFSPVPMETKLRELYGIFYRSDLTKAVQEKLWQIGYDLTIDGRAGSDTQKIIKEFQKDHGLAADGRITDELDARLKVVLATSKVRELSAYKPPPTVKPSRSQTYSQFTNQTVLRDIKAFYEADRPLFKQMENRFKVPGSLVASIMWIETGYGRFFGKRKAAFSLASMAAAADIRLVAGRLTDINTNSEASAFLSDYAAKRGKWAFDELRALLVYAWDNGLDPASFLGSVYGAIGYGQFMPSNINKFAADGDGDGRIDLFNKPDAIFSVGKYLAQSGWRGDMLDEEKRRSVIMLYNRSNVYVNTVLFVADFLAGQTP
ncbi:MAG: lytic murein transglycosylase [Deltaproteobacteria bacterium]|nr:lytic murein transglycosylase [Deltaproteobacteria bacterium]